MTGDLVTGQAFGPVLQGDDGVSFAGGMGNERRRRYCACLDQRRGAAARLRTGNALGQDHQDERHPESRSQQGASVSVDTLRGGGALTLSRSRSWILSDSLDMQSSRSISVQYDAVDARQASVTASQALKLIHPWTGTSLSAGTGVSNVSGDFSSTVAVSQAILPNLNLDASMNNPFSGDEAGSVNLRYRVNW